MKILLIYPPYKKEEVFSYLSDNAPVLPPLGLAYLAGYLRKHSCDVSIIDAPALNLKTNEILDLARPYKPHLIGITANSPLYSRALVLAERIKNYLPRSLIVFGGYHPTFLGTEVLRHNFVDFIVRGEGEETIVEFCKALENGNDFSAIKGLGFRDKGSIILNEEREFIQDLDKLPFPAYDLLPMGKYRLGNSLGKVNSSISLIVSRGCKGRCYFCTSPGFWKSTYRKHSPEYTISLMNYLYENFRIEHFQFRDDTFTLDRNWVMRLCYLLIDNKRKFRWDCYSRFDTIDESLLSIMKKAGCEQISLGVESANERILEEVKGISKDRIQKGMLLLKRYGYKTRLFFMVGPPAKTVQDIEDISRFAQELDPDILTVTASIPFPGSRFYSDYIEKGGVLEFDQKIPRVYEGFCNFDGFSREFMRGKVMQIYKNFYLRPSYITKQFLRLKNLNDIYSLFKGAVALPKLVFVKIKHTPIPFHFFRINLYRYNKYSKFARRKPLLVFRIAKTFLLSLFFKKRILRKMELALTYNCQCSCSKCSSFKLKNSEKRELSLAEIKKLAKEAYALGIFQVNFIGGEPLLRKNFIEIINCFDAKRTFLSISTNGILLTQDKIRELKKAGIDYIKISLDSPAAEEHDLERGWPNLFDTIMKAVEMIRSEGLLCELSTVVTRESIKTGKIWEVVKMCKEKTVILGLNIPAVCGKWSENNSVLLDDEERKILDSLVNYPHVIRDIQTGLFKTQCSAGKEQIYITAYGDILPCSVVQISFGNIREKSLKEIWDRVQSSKLFKGPQWYCLAGEDKNFINVFLKPINKIDKMPVPIEYFSK